MDERVSFQTVDPQMMTQKIRNDYVLWSKDVIRWIDECEWNFWNKSVVCHLLNITNCPWTNPALKSHLASSVMSWQYSVSERFQLRITVLSFSEHEIIEYENSKASKNMDGCELFELQRHLSACKHSNGFPEQESLFMYMYIFCFL